VFFWLVAVMCRHTAGSKRWKSFVLSIVSIINNRAQSPSMQDPWYFLPNFSGIKAFPVAAFP